MKLNILLAAAAFSLGVDAFYPYLTPAHKGAHRKVHLSDQISKAFAFQGSEVPLNDGAGLTKVPLRKRSHPTLAKRRALLRRENDFNYEQDNTPSAPQSAAMDQDGTDTSYFAEVTVGTNPGAKLLMLMDTGSSAMWVMGQSCDSDACKIHNLYGSDSSSSLKTQDGDFDISYQSGSVTGGMVSDQVSFAGMTLDVTFGVADQTSDDFTTYAMDGIMGLARSASGTDFDATPFIEVVKQDKTLKANVFGVWLDRAEDGDKNGEISFGAADESRYSGDLNYIDTNDDDEQRWQVPMDDAQLNGDSLGFSGKQAVVDTGTSLMFVPPSDAAAIFKGIDGATLPDGQDIYQLPCDTSDDLALVFNKVAYSISPKDYVGGAVSGASGTCYAHVIAIAAVGDDNTWLLGDTFLKNVYTVFDADQNRVGFGKPSSSADDTSSTSASPSSASAPAPSSASGSAPASGTAVTETPPAASVEALIPNMGGSVAGPSGTASGSAAKASGTGAAGSSNDNSDAMGSIGDSGPGGDAPAGPRGASAFGLAMAVGVMCMLW